jgi:hypothetical protein
MSDTEDEPTLYDYWLAAKQAKELYEAKLAEARENKQLNDLLFAVERKFPGETRFQTALRYIREAESRARDGHPAKSR